MPTGIAQKRLARRIQELYDSDPQFAGARSDETVSAAIGRPDLRLQLVGSRPSRRLCAQWRCWSSAGSNRRSYSTP